MAQLVERAADNREIESSNLSAPIGVSDAI